ncbi:hypothetical protein J27TS7_23630 [Paenibacillus dendritiformis]|nr:hypothetical protein J27TS7_23630 [Paenibacillus dendritiformis]
MKISTSFKHKSVVVSENDEHLDGRLARNTDVKGLSLGLAQWNRTGRAGISAKVRRSTGDKGARPSEELPLHRVLDMSILICRSLAHFREA